MSDDMVEDLASEEGSTESSSDDDNASIISEDTWDQVATYNFTDWMSGSMYLVQESAADAPKPIPAYRISTTLNLAPFFPICYVTQVSRPGADAEELVGQFEFSLNQKRGLFTVGNMVCKISEILLTVDTNPRHFSWNFAGYKFEWDCRTEIGDGSYVCICRTSAGDGSRARVASFMLPGPEELRRPSCVALNVYDVQQAHTLDQIVLSALIVERKLTLDM